MNSSRLGEQNRRREEYGRFSAAEVDRRREAVREMMAVEGLDALVLYGTAGNEGTQIEYLTNYAPTFATYVVFFADPDEPSLLLVGLSNHVQYVREVSEVDDVDVMLHDPPGKIASRLSEADRAIDTVGVVGLDPRYELTMPHVHYAALEAAFSGDIVDATAPYTLVHASKSDDELERVRRAGAVLDAGLEALEAAIEPGVTERDLAAFFERGCAEAGGSASVNFITSAPMEGAETGEGVTWHRPSNRAVRDGDVVTTELSAGYGGYKSQIHRPFAVGRDPSDTYRELYDLAEGAYERMVAALTPGNTVHDVHAAMADIEASTHKIYDVMLHGYGNGYLHPFVGTEASNYWPGTADSLTADWTFERGMVLVVQPNVVTVDETCGLQLGTTVIVDDEPEVVHEYPVRFTRV